MGSRLRDIGLLILAGTACLLVADALGWVPPGMADAWTAPLAAGGVVAIAMGGVFGLLSGWSRRVLQTKCVRCAATTERGQAYCLDHMQAALNEYRDHARDTGFRRERGKA